MLRRLSVAGLPVGAFAIAPGAPGPAITTPVVSTASSLAGDTQPTYAIDFVDAYPAGGGIGDTLEGRWGTSEAAMAAMTPESTTITEGMFIDGDDPFPALGTFSEAQALGTTIYFSFRVVRGVDSSDWSNTGTLLLEDGTMDAPGLADLTDQAASTRVWSAPFQVSGLAAGAYARLTGTGPIRVGSATVYEAGEQVQVQNGDGLEFGVDTAAGSGVTVDNVVSNRGVALETFSAATVVGSIVPLTKLVTEGDSITAWANSYSDLWAAANPSVPYANRAVGGSGIATMQDRLATVMSEEDPSHLTILDGANDLMEYATAVDFVTAVFAYVAAAKAIKPALQVGVCGVLPIDEDAPANSPPAKAGFNVRRKEVNTLLRAAVGNEIEFYIPLGEHPLLVDEAATEGGTYSTDGLHWNTGGPYSVMLETYAAVMDAILAESTGTVPNAFSFTDQANAPASSVQTARAVITGMGMGAAATMSGSGDGNFTRNQGAFGTSTFPMMNGDFAVARITASSTPSEELTEMITVGGVSDTFSVTTAAAGGADLAATADAQIFNGGFSSGSSRTFTAVPHPGGVPFIAASTDGGRTFTSVTFNGAALTAIASMDNGGDRFFIGSGEVPAGNYDIAVTLSSSIGTLNVWTGGLTGISSSTPIGVSKLASGFRFDGAHNGTSTITLGTGDIGVIFGSRDADSTISGFGPAGSLVKDYGTKFFAKFTASGTPTFTTSGSSGGDTTTSLTAAGFG